MTDNKQNSVFFSGNPLDRAGNNRPDDAWVAAQYAHSDTLFVPFWQLRPLVLPEAQAGAGRDIGWLPRPAFGDYLQNSDRLAIFLGINRRGKALFAIDISDAAAPETSGPFQNMGIFEDLRALAMAGDMPPTELAICAQAKALLDWHHRHQFCSQCGQATHISEGGYKRICAQCACDHFPRTDPVVIMLARHEDSCLVGRQEAWGENMFSALAGFMEPGETIEEAVARELYEEAAVEISAVHYVASQPWAFPASLMIGCFADATSRDIKIDGIELAEAKWISRAEIKAAFSGSGDFILPPKMAIARNLLEQFVA